MLGVVSPLLLCAARTWNRIDDDDDDSDDHDDDDDDGDCDDNIWVTLSVGQTKVTGWGALR